jgi:hypothetical protein
MSTENNPYLTVPDYGQLNQNFGKEKLYSGYTAPSAVSDLAAAAAASNLQTGARTPDKGKYVYDSKTGQYIWVPAGTAVQAPVAGLAASPAYMNQDRGGRDIDPKEQNRINNLFDSYASQDRVYGLPPGTTASAARAKDFANMGKFFMSPVTSIYGALKESFMGQQPKSMSEIGTFKGNPEDDAGMFDSYGNPKGSVTPDTTVSGVNDLGASDRNMGAMRGNTYGGYSSTPTGAYGSGKPGETAVGGAVAPTATNEGLTSRGITTAVDSVVDSVVDAAPPSDSDTGKDTGADGVGGRVICTHFYRKGEMDRDMWRADLEFTFKRLSPITVRGYQYWAIPYVRLMRKSKLAEDIIRPLAFARAKELAYKMGKSPKGSVFGKAVRLVFEPLCFAVGLFVGEQNWQALWTPVKD